jgi:hypothetical protein
VSRATAVVAAVLTFTLLAACGSPGPTPPPRTASAVPGSTASAGTSAGSPDPSSGWQLVAAGASGVASTLTDVVAAPDGFVAVGSTGPIGNVPVALRSTDGVTWLGEQIGSRGMAPARLTIAGERVVAVGGGETGQCSHPSAIDTWTRAADGTWTEAPFDDHFCVGFSTANLIAIDGRVLLFGSGSGDVVFDWTSDDGLHWTDHGPVFGDVYPRAGVSDGSTVWVFGNQPDGSPVALGSADGREFGPFQSIVGVGPADSVLGAVLLDGMPAAIVGRGSAAGIVRPASPAGWNVTEAAGLIASDVARVVAVDGHLVALGGDAAGTPLAWTSADGSSWRALTLPSMQTGTTLQGVAVRDGLAVIVGQVTNGGSGVGAAWTGAAELLAP